MTGHIIIFSGISGVGKTTIAKSLASSDPQLVKVKTCTTRLRRDNESDADYHFITEKEYRKLVMLDEFVEHAEVYGHCYGIFREDVLDILNKGNDAILVVDWRGARSLRQYAAFYPIPIIDIYIGASTNSGALERAVERGHVSSDRYEVECDRYASEYKWVVINHDFQSTVGQIRNIISVERASWLAKTQIEERTE